MAGAALLPLLPLPSSSSSSQRASDKAHVGLCHSILTTPLIRRLFLIFVGICIAAALQFIVLVQPPTPLASAPASACSPSRSSCAAAADEESRHAVFATAAGYPFSQLYPFVRSLRYACRRCQIILFVTNRTLTDDDRRHFRHFHIQLLFIDELQPLYRSSSLVADERYHAQHYRFQLYYDYLRRLTGQTNLSLSQSHHFNPISLELINQSRHAAYHSPTRYSDPYSRPSLSPDSDGWLRDPALSSSISHVFFCDARDLIFQQNIFHFLPYRHQFEGDDLLYQDRHREPPPQPQPHTVKQPTSEGVFVFTEERPLAEEPINQNWIRCADQSTIPFASARTLPVLCSGTTLASVGAALLYLDALLSVMYEHLDCVRSWKGFDQGAHIIAVYGGRVQAPVFLIPNARGPVATISMMNHPLHQTEYGQLLNERGEIYAVVHQYDRQIYHLKPQYEKQFSMIATDNLTWQY